MPGGYARVGAQAGTGQNKFDLACTSSGTNLGKSFGHCSTATEIVLVLCGCYTVCDSLMILGKLFRYFMS